MTQTPQPLPDPVAGKGPRLADALAPIRDFIGDPVMPADFPQVRLRWRNDRAAADVGLDALDDAAWIAHFARFQPLAGTLAKPLALRYHGHQFGTYNPDLGDGRGFVFAQGHDRAGRLLDLGTKGSGQTPYSRFGDGRLTLKGAVREILATEMLEALGVPTSRTLSVVETGEALWRGDEPSPARSAVLVRLSHGHMRIGTIQRLAALGLQAELSRFVHWWLVHYAQGGSDMDDRSAGEALFTHALEHGAHLAAAYMVAGFVHGVLNTDNINLTGESFDYGPWRFAPTYDPGFVAAYFDEAGRYAFGRQPGAILWALTRLGHALLGLAGPDERARTAMGEALDRRLEGFAPLYRQALAGRMIWRLGVSSQGPARDQALCDAVDHALLATQAPLEAFFFDWAGGHVRRPEPYRDPVFEGVRAHLADRQPTIDPNDEYWNRSAPVSLRIDRVEALWAPIADHDDWAPFHATIADIRQMGEALGKQPPCTG